uniref:Uncharacterized protein n=1 Tax=Chromera velia CCMP2878 TaxID=1169474 RepID=A0A0G4H958_9ALVE|eukprot:Cvel_5946.t1-p1 / transcript=Cvel_5946.t1 / gene=Cvel_5946 / organism=Chromera_velia_CCMP2878 / gene_product=hypothetical protein / transcript_product=hypothetical protein / location=Cvel_scaffold284:65937-68147(+) / protein_length=210 / sequence_SO=supercontig / SO=protein_coding / is_pseudo=false
MPEWMPLISNVCPYPEMKLEKWERIKRYAKSLRPGQIREVKRGLYGMPVSSKLFDDKWVKAAGKAGFIRVELGITLDEKKNLLKKQSRVRWARGVLASPDDHNEEEVKEAKEVVAKEGGEDGSRPAVNPAPHTADAPPGLQGASMVFYPRSHGPLTGAIARPTLMTAPMVAPMYSFPSSFLSPYPYHQGYSDGMLNRPQPLPAPHFFPNS